MNRCSASVTARPDPDPDPDPGEVPSLEEGRGPGGFSLVMDRQPDPVVAWIDGQCPLCLGSRSWVEERDLSDAVSFRDFRTCPRQSLARDRDEHDEALWVRSADGSLHRGFAAVLTLLATLPRWRWLVPLASWAPSRWLGECIYGLVAHHRHRHR